MAILKADSPISRRIVLSFLDFLNSVEASSASDAESIEVARDCLSEAFKIDSSSTSTLPNSDSLIHIFSSQNNEIKSDQIHRASSTNNAPIDTNNSESSQCLGDKEIGDTRTVGVGEDELFGQFFGALEKVHYFGTIASGDDEQALDRATHLFHNALKEMKKSGSEEFDLKKLADTFKLQGNKGMQSKVYSEAIELYTIAIALCNDNAVYYCNRAAAYTQTNQHAEAIADCNKAIAIDPNYSKAYSRLGFTYYAQGNYNDAIHKGFKKALQLDPNNESIKGNIRAAEQKLLEEQQRGGHGQGSWSSSSNGRSHGGSFTTGFPMNIPESFDWAGMIPPEMRPTNNNQNPNPNTPDGDHRIPEEMFGVLRSAFQMFGGQHSQTHPQQDNNNNNNNASNGN